jgi:hypothetical protein
LIGFHLLSSPVGRVSVIVSPITVWKFSGPPANFQFSF